MKVAFIVSQFPSLSETFILNQITGLIDRGCELDIYAQYGSRTGRAHRQVDAYKLLERTYYLSATEPSRISRAIGLLHSLTSHLWKRPLTILRALNVVKYGWSAASLVLLRKSFPTLDKDPYDIIHCQFGPNGMLGVRLRDIGALKGKIITHFRGFDCSAFVRANGPGVYRELFSKGDLFLCVSEGIKKKVMDLGCSEAKIMVHRSGVDLESLPVAQPSCRTGVRLLTIARLVEKKGVRYAVEAVARLVPQYPDLEYGIIGDGPLRDSLQALIRRLKVEDHIKLLGWRSREEVSESLGSADIVLVPSVTGGDGDEEGIPNVIMEAFARGLPVVASRHGGIPEIVHDGESGFLVPEGDVETIGEKVRYLIENPKLRLEMGLKGRRHVEENHDIHKLNDRLLAIYRGLLGTIALPAPGRDRRSESSPATAGPNAMP